MLIIQFILVNANFVICLGTALVLFAIFWLYFDAWLNSKELADALHFIGFLLLSVSFVAQAVIIDQSILAQSIISGQTLTLILSGFRISGYLTLIIAQMKTPLQKLPGYRKKKEVAVAFAVLSFTPFSFPILAALTGLLYLRRATTGLEHHLKPISLAFFILALSELAGLSSFFRVSDNITIANLTSAFGPIWITQRIILTVAIYIFGTWAWSYLLKRFESQLFILFTASTLFIFLLTAVSFTFATLNNVKRDILTTLKTDVGVLGYTIDSKKSEVTADAQILAQDPELISALSEGNRKALADKAVPILVNKKASELVIISSSGGIVLRAEDTEARGGSLSDDPLVKIALTGKSATSVVTREGAIAPMVSVRSAVPVITGNETIGVILMGSDIDNAYVDGIKNATGLDASIYADDVRSATTFISPDGKSRYVGIKETSQAVKNTVLTENLTYTGSVTILNIPYFSAFAPLVNSDNNPVGMLFVGRPEASILKTASRSIELTFITTAILLVLSVAPAYFISKYLVSQIK